MYGNKLVTLETLSWYFRCYLPAVRTRRHLPPINALFFLQLLLVEQKCLNGEDWYSFRNNINNERILGCRAKPANIGSRTHCIHTEVIVTGFWVGGGIFLFFFVKKLTLILTFLLVNVFKQVNDSLDVNSETFGEPHLNWVTNKIRNKSKIQHFCRLFKPGID